MKGNSVVKKIKSSNDVTVYGLPFALWNVKLNDLHEKQIIRILYWLWQQQM